MKESKEIKGKFSVSLQAFLLLHGTLLLYAVVTVLTKLASGYLSQANWPMTLLFLFFSVAALRGKICAKTNMFKFNRI